MILRAKLLRAGYSIAYVAEAEVIHSHDFSVVDVFRRYFRMGWIVEEHRDILGSARKVGDGVDFALRQLVYLYRNGYAAAIPRAVAELAFKGVGYNCGRLGCFMVQRSRRGEFGLEDSC
jgi:rhamnosyltransferase